MSVIIRPRKWTQQPTGPVEIDWSNPLTSGLQEVLHPTFQWDATRKILLLGGGTVTAETTVAKFGTARQFGANRQMSTVATNKLSDAILPRTIFFQHQLTSAGNANVWTRAVAAGTPSEVFTTVGLGASYRYSRQVGGVNVGNSVWGIGTVGVTSNLVLTNDGVTAANTVLYENGVVKTRIGTGGAAVTTATLPDKIYLGTNSSGAAAANTKMSLYLVWTRILTLAEIKEISRNPWQIFKPISNKIYIDGGGASPNATVAITGVAGTGQVGTVVATGSAVTSITGVSGAGQVGTVVATPSVSVAITGVSGTGEAGTVTAKGDANTSVSGVSGSGAVGDVVAGGGAIIAVTGVSGAGEAGSVTAKGDANTSISGVEGVGQVGDVFADGAGNANVSITGVSGTGQVGTVVATGNATVAISGVEGTGQVGTVVAVGTIGGRLKYWDGAVWTLKPISYWDGAAWTEKTLKYWDGSAWTS